MNIVYMAKSAWTGLLDTIRSKAGVTGSMTVSEAAEAVESITGEPEIKTATATTGTRQTVTINFTGFSKMPAFFVAYANNDYTLTATNVNIYIMSVIYNGSACGRTGFSYNSSSSVRGKGWTHGQCELTISYSNGTLTITSPGSTDCGFFPKNTTYTMYYM